MSKRMIFAGCILAAGFAAYLVIAQQAQAESGVPVRFAVQTTIGPNDAPVRTAEFNSTDRQKTSVDPVHWGYGGRGWYGGGYARGGFYGGGFYGGGGGWYGRGWNVGYRPYYAYRPYYYSYYPRYYSGYYPSYYVSNYAPPFYYPTYYAPSFAPCGSCYYW